jgi:hypothetical protein
MHHALLARVAAQMSQAMQQVLLLNTGWPSIHLMDWLPTQLRVDDHTAWQYPSM